jgi:hypothetical protein
MKKGRTKHQNIKKTTTEVVTKEGTRVHRPQPARALTRRDYQRGSRGGRSTPDGSIANESMNPASASSAAVVGIIGIE